MRLTMYDESVWWRCTPCGIAAPEAKLDATCEQIRVGKEVMRLANGHGIGEMAYGCLGERSRGGNGRDIDTIEIDLEFRKTPPAPELTDEEIRKVRAMLDNEAEYHD